jgi:predicted Zn-dependent peptidase
VLGAVAEELDRLATGDLPQQELDRTVARMTARYYREVDSVLGRALHLATYEQQRDRGELVNELPALLREVTTAQVQAAAATLTADTRTVLELRPGSAA